MSDRPKSARPVGVAEAFAALEAAGRAREALSMMVGVAGRIVDPALLDRAVRLALRLGRDADALVLCRRAAQLSPLDPWIARVLGTLLQRAGRPELGERALRRALVLDPGSPETGRALADCPVPGKPARIVRWRRVAVTGADSLALVRKAVGEILGLGGDPRTILRDGVRRFPADSRMWADFGSLDRRRDPEAARGRLIRGMLLEPAERFPLATLTSLLSRDPASVRLAALLLAVSPENPGSWVLSWYARNRPPDPTPLRRALVLEPRAPHAYVLASGALGHTGQVGLMDRVNARLCVLDPGSRAIPGTLLHSDLLAGRPEAARARIGRQNDDDLALAHAIVRPGDTVLDIGAHIGKTAHYFLHAGAGSVHCFEAEPGAFERLRRAVPDEVTCHHAAVGDRSGTTEIWFRHAASGAASLIRGFARTTAGGSEEGLRAARVPVLRIDDLDVGRPEVWKIDVEGSELAVLRGAARTLAAAPPRTVQIELFGPPLNSPEHLQEIWSLLVGRFRYCYRFVGREGGRARVEAALDVPARSSGGSRTPLYVFSREPIAALGADRVAPVVPG